MNTLTDISVVGRAARLGRAFVPTTLFTPGTTGAWFDPADRASLFQDAAGTVPVTAAGQPVGRMLDKSGLGRHATQSVGAARPTYRLDSNGRAYLEFDGVDDWMSFGPLSLSGKTAATLALALRKTQDVGSGLVFATGTWLGAGIDIRSPGAWGAANFGANAQSTSGAQSIGVTTSNHAAPLPAAMTLEIDLAKPAGAELSLRVNHVAFAQTTGTTLESGGSLAGTTAYLGRRQDAPVLLFSGRLYGFMLLARGVSAVERQQLEFLMAQRIGVTP